MADNFAINQKSTVVTGATQIGVQNNFNGLTPIEACNLATTLFYDNFPKLEEAAMHTAERRINEFMGEVAKKLQNDNVTDMAPFSDPDVQYSLFEAQKCYARFGTEEMLSILSDLISSRVQYNDRSTRLKVSIDNAIEIAGLMSQSELDFLSLTFLVKQVKSDEIKTIDDLKSHISYLAKAFSAASISATPYLDSLKCLKIYLGSAAEIYSETYGFSKEKIEAILPEIFHQIHGDYGTSPIGTVLAIVNAKEKTTYKLPLETWIN